MVTKKLITKKLISKEDIVKLLLELGYIHKPNKYYINTYVNGIITIIIYDREGVDVLSDLVNGNLNSNLFNYDEFYDIEIKKLRAKKIKKIVNG